MKVGIAAMVRCITAGEIQTIIVHVIITKKTAAAIAIGRVTPNTRGLAWENP
jgi:hypothetical protein